jgi:signal peptidase I
MFCVNHRTKLPGQRQLRVGLAMVSVIETDVTAGATATGDARRGVWPRLRSTISTVLTALVVILASVMVVLSVATHLSAHNEYRVFGHPVMAVLSGSMAPTIHTGDLIIDNSLSVTQAEHLHVGQIISVRDAPGSMIVVTHRIVAVVHSGSNVAYITKGDANNAPDGAPRPVSDVVGVLSGTIPDGGYVLNALHQPLVPLLLLASILLALAAGPLLAWARRMDESDEEPSDPTTTADSKSRSNS